MKIRVDAGMCRRAARSILIVAALATVTLVSTAMTQDSIPHYGGLPGESSHMHVDLSLFMTIAGALCTAVLGLCWAVWFLIRILLAKADAETETAKEIAPLAADLVAALPRFEKAVEKLSSIICYKQGQRDARGGGE